MKNISGLFFFLCIVFFIFLQWYTSPTHASITFFYSCSSGVARIFSFLLYCRMCYRARKTFSLIFCPSHDYCSEISNNVMYNIKIIISHTISVNYLGLKERKMNDVKRTKFHHASVKFSVIGIKS